MGAQGHEALGLDAVAAPQHPHDGRLQVVVADAPGRAAEVGEGADVAVEEHLLALVEVGPRKRAPGGGQAHEEQLDLGEDAGQVDADGSEVDLGLLAQGMALGNHHLGDGDLLTGAHLGHEAPNRGLADHDLVLLEQALPHAPGGVTLLAGRAAVGLQPGDDQWLPRIEGRRPRRRLLAGRRYGAGERGADRATVGVEALGQRQDRQALALVCLPDLLEQPHARPLRHGPTVEGGLRSPVDPQGWAKSGEHSPLRVGQIR